MKPQLTFLGTGGSMGIPVIGCGCAVCTSANPKDRRLRPSVLVEIGDKKLLIDSGPDLREQLLREGVSAVDAVLLTHLHSDHTAGMDDLRALYIYRREKIPCVMSESTYADLRRRWPYIFGEEALGLVPQIEPVILPEERGELSVAGVGLHYFTYTHAKTKVQGFRFGDLAYVTDIHEYEESIFSDLEGVERLVLSALREETSRFHFTVTAACDFARRVGAKELWLTHMAHEISHDEVDRLASPVGRAAYDGLKI